MIRIAWLVLLLAVAPAPAGADWLTRILAASERAGGKAAIIGAGALDRLARHIKTAAAGKSGPVLGAAVSHEGHWTFVNAAGERLTAGNADEMRRIIPVLTGAGGEVKPTLVLSEDSIFRHREHLGALPPSSGLAVLVGTEAYPLVRRGEALFAEARPGVLIETTGRAAFEEAAYQLARPLQRSEVRILSLAVDGPQTLPRLPALGADGRPLTDLIDPYRLPAALSVMTGQTAVVIGRVEGTLLNFRLPAGGERSLLLADLTAAAARHDVNLIVLQAPAARQPGTRTWLWQRVEVKGLEQARDRSTLADFVDALAGSDRAAPMTVGAAAHDSGRTRLTLRQPDAGSGVGSLVADLTAEVTGRIVSAGADAYLVSADRQTELQQRLVPGIPAGLQYGYVGLLVAGLIGLPAARRWWLRLWPPEQRADYAGAAGYQAARIVKLLVFVLAFLPLVGLPAAVWHTVRQTADLLAWPFRRIAAAVARGRA
ncbi:MAG: hypothetical protein ACOYLQ_16920 [Hyphomicrobiaceae bacterium]